jgi:arylsulfatase A-like enzyme
MHHGPLATLLAFSLATLACGAAERPRNAVLVSIDTLRADHLGCYGHPLPTSPHLDALASDGVLFEDVSSTAPWTLPAHASLLTGLYPNRTGVRTLHHALPADVDTLATRLALQGFETMAVVNSLYLTRASGLDQGFARFEAIPEDQSAEGAAAHIVDTALAWLAKPPPAPFLLFVHIFDVHSDYRSRAEVERLFTERRSPVEGSSAQLMRLVGRGASPRAERAERLSRLYDAGIRQVDDELGRLFAALGSGERAADTLVVVTSDHGEEFGDHGSVLHGGTQHREILHVPLIMHGPGVPAGVRVSTPASLVDVVPTVLDLLGIAPPADLDGRSLRASWAEPRASGATRPLFAEAAPAVRGDTRLAVRLGRYELLVDDAAGTRALYDLETDPRETRDVAAEQPSEVERLAGLLAAHRSTLRQGARSGPISDAQLRQLRALGYVVDGDGAGNDP